MINKNFWHNKRVFFTGNTGFKGSWLSLWLVMMGAEVYGYSLNPPTVPSLFDLGNIDKLFYTKIADVRDYCCLEKSIREFQPEIVIHMAAQPLVRDSYKFPVETYEINVMGTVHVLETIRKVSSVHTILNITTDKCYENKEWVWGYRENEPLGGYDPYSSSKACSELITAAYRNSYFNPKQYNIHKVSLASARAGNVIGGGDWAKDRLIPDCVNSLINNEPILIRNPNSIRPWQYVLEPLAGYLMLCEKQYEKGEFYAESWNFGPDDKDAKPVEYIANKMCKLWGNNAQYIIDNRQHSHEAGYLKLDCSKAKNILNWRSMLSLDAALEKIVEWIHCYMADKKAVKEFSIKQINEYMKTICEEKHYG